MRPPADYRAQRAIQAPGTMVYAFQRGDDVPAASVENWELTVGEDGDVLPVNADVIPRPEDDAERAAWEAYVIGQGTDTTDARAMSLDDLRSTYDADSAEQPVTVPDDGATRPADSDKKALWIDYVVASGGDPGWANADGTTKADLMNWQNDKRVDSGPDPELASGDPVAEHAGDLANG